MRFRFCAPSTRTAPSWAKQSTARPPLTGEWDEPSSKVGLDIFLGERTLLYFLMTSSYKSGGLNPPAFTGAFEQEFDPELIDAVEVGFKTAGRRAVFNLTLFQYDYTGLQVSKIVDRTSVNENINAEISGAEPGVPLESFGSLAAGADRLLPGHRDSGRLQHQHRRPGQLLPGRLDRQRRH